MKLPGACLTPLYLAVDMERNRAVTNEEAEAYAASVDATLFGTSAKVGRWDPG